MSSNTCANCGKEGSDVTNACNKCNSVQYCNAACKKKHRKKHKKECERRVAEIHDELLFKQPPPLDDCPICFLRMPSLTQVQVYMACCGKVVCRGCFHANLCMKIRKVLVCVRFAEPHNRDQTGSWTKDMRNVWKLMIQ